MTQYMRILLSALALSSTVAGVPAQAGRYDTSLGNAVPHCHIGDGGCFPRELNATEVQNFRRFIETNHPKTSEVLPPTRRYNCHGYAHARSHAWFADPQRFMADDYLPMTVKDPKPGDVVVYMDEETHTHSAVVLTVNGNKITMLRSKWGQSALLDHTLRDVPEAYGEPVYYIRRKPEAVMAMTGEEKWTFLDYLASEAFTALYLASSTNALLLFMSKDAKLSTLVERGDETIAEISDFLQRGEEPDRTKLSVIAFLLSEVNSVDAKALLSDTAAH